MTPPTIYETPRPAGRPGETVVTSTCGHNCGGRCVVNAHVVNGRIARISSDPARWKPGAAAAAGLRARLRPDRARVPPRPAAASAAAHRARAAAASSSASRGTRRSTRSPARCCACARQLRQRRDPRRLPLGQPRPRCMAGQRRSGFLYMFGGCTELWSNISAEAEVFAVRMTYGAKAVLQERRTRAHRLRQLQADPDVGLEPGRRHLRHGHLAVPPAGEEAGRAHRLRRPAPDAVEPGAGGRARLHPAVDRRRGADRHGAT